MHSYVYDSWSGSFLSKERVINIPISNLYIYNEIIYKFKKYKHMHIYEKIHIYFKVIQSAGELLEKDKVNQPRESEIKFYRCVACHHLIPGAL